MGVTLYFSKFNFKKRMKFKYKDLKYHVSAETQ